eukprot:TRINITY_DN34824_c0_g1_i1.p1 TRINITY_DN34824_c0_g1~~TRINITY_DN34824_c0_g1_i1.p1  ORF type:complete len:326 (+),score=77.39 TRINITY_DN34824_c0_g1_i1:132-1109(+)
MQRAVSALWHACGTRWAAGATLLLWCAAAVTLLRSEEPTAPPCPPCKPCGPPADPLREQACLAAEAESKRRARRLGEAEQQLTQCRLDSGEARRRLEDAADGLARADSRAMRAEDSAARAEAARAKQRAQQQQECGNPPRWTAAEAWSAAARGQPAGGALGIAGLNLTQAQLLGLARLSDEALRARLRAAAAQQLRGVWRKSTGDTTLRVYADGAAPHVLRVEVQGNTVGGERIRLHSVLEPTGDAFTVRWGEAGEAFRQWGEEGVSRMELFPDGTLLENSGPGHFLLVAADPAAEVRAPPPPRRRWKLRAAADVETVHNSARSG